MTREWWQAHAMAYAIHSAIGQAQLMGWADIEKALRASLASVLVQQAKLLTDEPEATP